MDKEEILILHLQKIFLNFVTNNFSFFNEIFSEEMYNQLGDGSISNISAELDHLDDHKLKPRSS